MDLIMLKDQFNFVNDNSWEKKSLLIASLLMTKLNNSSKTRNEYLYPQY